jgi:hypothetical protein
MVEKESGRFFEKKLRKKLLLYGGTARLIAAAAAFTLKWAGKEALA